MSTQADPLGGRVIITGRAYVRLIEAAEVLPRLDRAPLVAAGAGAILSQVARAGCGVAL